MNATPVLDAAGPATAGDARGSVGDAMADAAPTVHAIALAELADLPGAAGDRALAGNPLHDVKIRLQVSVGEVSLTIGDLMAARQHQILTLDRSVDQPIDVLLEGRVVARGQLVAVDDRFAIRLTELPVPLEP